MPSRSVLGALPGTGAGEARERGRRPLAHVAGLWPACGRDARAPRGWPCERCPWERGHLARNGPKARKAPTGATRPSRLHPRPRRPMPSRSVLGAMSLGARASCPHRAEGPQSADRSDTPEPATPPPEAPNAVEVGLGCDVPGSAGILPATGRRPARRREERPTRATHSPPEVPNAVEVGLGCDVLGARASCPQRAEGPQSADRNAPPEPATPPPEAPNAVEVGLGCDVPGSAGILPATGRRPAKCRQERHARAGHPPARGAQCRRGRPWERCSWERGHLARNGPKARKVPTGATRPSRLLPRPRRPMPSRSVLGAMFLGARASCPQRAEGPQGADRSDTPEPATPPPEAPNAVEVGLGCTAEDWHWRSPRAWASPACPCGGPVARLRAGRPRSQGPCERCPGSAGILPATGRRPARCRQERHARAGYSPARGAQCRRGRSWVHCRGLALEEPESVGVARLAMWRACGPLAGGTPALPGCGPVSDVPGSAGILPATGRRPARR